MAASIHNNERRGDGCANCKIYVSTEHMKHCVTNIYLSDMAAPLLLFFVTSNCVAG